jgi:phosphatidylglycerol:prolipoprotein diacylglycerol transferase
MIDAYLGFVLAGAGVGSGCFVLAWRRAALPVGWRVVGFLAGTVASGLVGARAYAVIERGWTWGMAAGVEGGLRLPGAAVGLLLGLVVWRAVFLPQVALGVIGDLGAIAAQFGLAVARLGCLAQGCCFGTVCSLPWAIRFPLGSPAADTHTVLGLIGPVDTASLPVHPLQIYFMLLHLGVGAFLLAVERRKAYDGQLLLLALVLGDGGKALLEGFRQPIPGMPELHLRVASVALATVAALALTAMTLRSRTRRVDAQIAAARAT